MLNRQKVLMEMLRQARRPVTKIELVKWAFVLRHEADSGGGSSFYDFVPYHYGPYSFALTREVEALAAMGYVKEREKTWESNGSDGKETNPSGTGVCRDVGRVVSRFVAKPLDDLLDYVYRKYPAFTALSKLQRRASRPVAKPSVYTAGYEGLQVDGFLNLLFQSGIERLVDVRRNPIARRFGFHKGTLSRLCGNIGIAYEHLPELGIASEQRRTLSADSDYATLFENYEHTTLAAEQDAVARVARLVTEKPSVLVCMEADHRFCHRSRVAAEIARRTKLPIVNLEA